jgi:uncharacterized repeat protein (TIGR03803 family)
MHFQVKLILLLVIAVCRSWQAAGAATFESLHEFVLPGAQPLSALVEGADGNFYGTTVAGGPEDAGTIYRMTPAGVLTTIYNFSSAVGSGPAASMIRGTDGLLYGTASAGGTNGFGMVFSISLTGQFTSLLNFTGTVGGSIPAGLVQHSDGNFYGLTRAGGANGFGTVFKLTSSGVFSTLLEFTGTSGAAKGAEPVGALTFSGSTLYGVTKAGGANGLGVIYKLTTAGAYTLMAEFTGSTGTRLGSAPSAGLVYNTSDSALYGTTEYGGSNTDFGTAYKITTAASPVFTTLRNFAHATGSQPMGPLVKGADGLFYGTSAGGGTNGFGVIYKMTTGGVPTVLVHFTGPTGLATGAASRAGLMLGTDGNFWGATSAGGGGNRGNVYKVTPAGGFTNLANFSSALGWAPAGAPVAESATTWLCPLVDGGANGAGTMVRMTLDNAVVSVAAIADFGGTAGSAPSGGLLKVGTDFYGVTTAGGASNRGTTYVYNAAGLNLLANHSAGIGSAAEGPLVRGQDGALYGSSREGGSVSLGSLTRVSTAGTRTRLVSFTGSSGAVKGQRPRGPLALAANTNFYGLTESGGSANAGTLFRLSAAGTPTVFAEFAASGPRTPLGGLVAGTDGFLYGTTSLGGAADGGTLLKVDPSTNTWSAAAEFTAVTGTQPVGTLTVGPDGALYGMTAAGGSSGMGTVFRYDALTGLTNLISFTGNGGSAPGRPASSAGSNPVAGGLAFTPSGALFGFTASGGTSGGGVAFRVADAMPVYNRWKLEKLGSAVAADTADADGDGIPNLLEYAQGTLPTVADAGSGMAVGRAGNELQLTFRKSLAAGDVVLTVQQSATLNGNWTTTTLTPQVIATEGSICTLQLTVPVVAPGHQFYRLNATH